MRGRVEAVDGRRSERAESEDEDSVWQREGCEEAVGAVLAWLRGGELVRVGAVCRAWRDAALEPALWRRALLPAATPDHLRALRRAIAAADLHTDSSWSRWSWRREYFLSAGRWALRERRLAAGGATVTHAALSHKGDRLAITADDATLTMWERSGANTCAWRLSWQRSEKARGWAAAGAARWAPDDARILLAGPLALADRWEIVVLRFDESGQVAAEVRAESGSCGGCWVDEVVFATLSVRLLGPARAVSTLWLNAAEQKVQSEYAGVTTPALRIYNESAAHISHLVVADTAAENLENLENTCSNDENASEDIGNCPDPLYWHATLPVRAERWERVVVAALGAAGGERGVARALGVWRLPLRAPAPLFAVASLAERVQQREMRPHAPLADARPPSEEELRALCMPPLATCKLQCRVLGLQLNPNGGCVWASTRLGAECVSLPALRPLLRVSATNVTTPALELPYLLQPAISDDFIVTPAGDGSGLIQVWAARSGARGATITHPAPAIAAVLAAHPSHLLVLAGDSLYLKRRLSGGPGDQKASPRRSCAGEKLLPCAECTPPPPPPCRAEKKSSMTGVRVACRPPPPAYRPPCLPPQQPCTVTCDHLHTQNSTTSSQKKDGCHPITERCGDSLDRVAQRIAAAKLARRLDYEREVAARIKKGSRAPPVPAVNYLLGTEREVARATDGRDYVVLPSTTDSATNSQSPRTVQLDPAKDCTIKRSIHVDPCAYQPRTLLEIKRSEVNNISLSDEKNENVKNKDSKGDTISKNQCKKNSVSKLTAWCSSPPELTPDPSPCRQPTLVDRLKVQSKSSCDLKRKIHTIPSSCQSKNKQDEKRSPETEINAIISKINTEKKKFDKMMSERNELKESGRGRTGFLEHTEEATINGLLELQVPPGTHRVRVNVGLHSAQSLGATPPRRCPTSIGGNAHNLCSGKNNSWLSIKNIQKKFSGCRKESTPTKNVDTKDCTTQQPTSTKTKQNLPETICQPKASTEPSPCDRKQNISTNPCQLKQKTKQSPCDTKPPVTCTKKCSSAFEIASNTIIST